MRCKGCDREGAHLVHINAGTAGWAEALCAQCRSMVKGIGWEWAFAENRSILSPGLYWR